MRDNISLVKNAMLAVQRYPWEQGVCAQALWEMGDTTTAVAMAHDAVLRQQEDGRLAVTGENIAVTDPAANGVGVFRAYELTGEELYFKAARRMLDYLMNAAPRTEEGIICHNQISFHEGFSEKQVWVDSIYMAPPFLALMGEIDEAFAQVKGYIAYLRDENTGLLYHIYDAETKRFVRRRLWATGNGWALLGIAGVAQTALKQGRDDIAAELIEAGREILDAMLKYQLQDGRFHDILDDEGSFVEGAAAMMMSAFIYRGICGGWLDEGYEPYARRVVDTMDHYIDQWGIIRQVCGCPHFVGPGTSAESMAAYLMMRAHYSNWKNKLNK